MLIPKPGTDDSNPVEDQEKSSDTDSVVGEAGGEKVKKRTRRVIPVPIVIVCPEKRSTRGNAPKRYVNE